MSIGNGEADPLRRLDDRGVDPDDAAPAVEQRAAAIARVERGVGLDHVVDEVSGDAPQAAAQGADDPGGHRRVEAERAADGDHELPDAQLGRDAERCVRQPGRVGLHDRDVGPRVGAHNPAGDLPAIVQTHPQPVRAPDDVVIGQQEAVGREQEPRPRSAAPPRAGLRLSPQVHHRGPQRLGHRHDHPRIGIHRLAFLLLERRSIGNRRGRLGIRTDQPQREWVHSSRPFLSRTGLRLVL